MSASKRTRSQQSKRAELNLFGLLWQGHHVTDEKKKKVSSPTSLDQAHHIPKFGQVWIILSLQTQGFSKVPDLTTKFLKLLIIIFLRL
jgi:hypothetical protein